MTITLFAAIAATALAAPLVRNANAQGGPTVRPTVEAAAATRWTIIHATKLRTKEPFTAHYDAKSTSTAAPATHLDARGDGKAVQGGPPGGGAVNAKPTRKVVIIHATKKATKEPFTAHFDAESTSTAAPATHLDARGDGEAAQSSAGAKLVNQMPAWMRSLADAFSAWGTGH